MENNEWMELLKIECKVGKDGLEAKIGLSAGQDDEKFQNFIVPRINELAQLITRQFVRDFRKNVRFEEREKELAKFMDSLKKLKGDKID